MSKLTSYKIELINNKASFQMKGKQSIYAAALDTGLQLPIGCNYGGCISCAAKLISGKVRQPGGTALNKRQSKAGYILLCVAKPITDCIIEEGVESHGELYQNPFLSKNLRR
jgi:ferredoxin